LHLFQQKDLKTKFSDFLQSHLERQYNKKSLYYL